MTTGATRAEVERNTREAIQLHLEGLKDAACEVPEPRTWSAYVEVSA